MTTAKAIADTLAIHDGKHETCELCMLAAEVRRLREDNHHLRLEARRCGDAFASALEGHLLKIHQLELKLARELALANPQNRVLEELAKR